MPDTFSMDHYEELGLAHTATPEEIRKAHRVLSRLLHPDQQTDDSLRHAAELQMRRVNAMVDVLLDPDRRRHYDESLRAAHALIQHPRTQRVRPARRRRSPGRVLALLTIAAALTLLAFWVAGETSWRGISSWGF